MTYLIILLIPYAIYQMRIINHESELDYFNVKKIALIGLFLFSLFAPLVCLYDIFEKFDLTGSNWAYLSFFIFLAYLVFIINYTSKKIEE